MGDLIPDIISFLNLNYGAISVISSIVLVLVTAFYVYLTKKILDSTKHEFQISFSPVIGIRLNDMIISPVYGENRRTFNINVTIVNVGNAPAIEVLIDSEIELTHSNINGEKIIPARFEPTMIPFLRQGEELPNSHEVNAESHITSQSFGNSCINHMIFDFTKNHELNIERIHTNSSDEPYVSTKLRVFVYCKNHLNQYFLSQYETYIEPHRVEGNPIPCSAILENPGLPNNRTIDLIQHDIPRPIFLTKPISYDEMKRVINSRNEKRNLCGW
jgi:hypothetical protein